MKSASARYVVIGNSTAAVGAVEAIRRADPEGSLILLSREARHTYSRPLISYLLARETTPERMYYRPQDFYEKNRVDARLGVSALAVDAGRRRVRTSDGGDVAFTTLLLANGGRPFVPDMPGKDSKGVFTFTSWDDAEALDAWISSERSRRAVVIGGGLIGLKAAEALRARSLAVTIVELAERILPLALDETASRMARRSLENAGIEVLCSETVSRIESESGRVAAVELRSGRMIPCGLVVVAIGVVPDTAVASAAGIACARGVLVNERMETSIPGIYAAGDVTQGRDALTGESRPIPIFPNAYRQGAVAGANMAGGSERHRSAFAMNSVEFCGLCVVSAGLATASGDEYEILAACDEDKSCYRKMVLRNDKVVGAILVGEVDRAGIVTGLIREGVDASSFKRLLLTDEFGIISLPAEYRKHVVRGEGVEV